MSHSWESYEKAAERGPLSISLKVIGLFFVLGLVLIPVSLFFGWVGETQQVAKEQFGPRALLAKYEWFKDSAAQLDKKRADIRVYSVRLSSMLDSYSSIPRYQWDRTDKEQWALWQSELAGVKASYNGLAAQYNSQMAKFNWAFANAGSLPQGATEPLPREFKPYVEG